MANLPPFTSMLQQFKDAVDMTEVLSHFSPSESLEDMFAYLWNHTEAHCYLTPCMAQGDKVEEESIRYCEIANEKYQAKDTAGALKNYNLSIMHAPHPRVMKSQGDPCCRMHEEPVTQQDDRQESEVLKTQHPANYGSSSLSEVENRDDMINRRETDTRIEPECSDARRDHSVQPKVFEKSQSSSDNQELLSTGKRKDLEVEQIQSIDYDVSVKPRISVKSEFEVSRDKSKSDEGKSENQNLDQDSSRVSQEENRLELGNRKEPDHRIEQESCVARGNLSVRPKSFGKSHSSADDQVLLSTGKGKDLKKEQIQSTDKSKDVSVKPRSQDQDNSSVYEEENREDLIRKGSDPRIEQEYSGAGRDQSVQQKVFDNSQSSAGNQELLSTGKEKDLKQEQIQSSDESKDVSVKPRITAKSDFSLSGDSYGSNEGRYKMDFKSHKQSPDKDNCSKDARGSDFTDPISSPRDKSSKSEISQSICESVESSGDRNDGEGVLEYMEARGSELNDDGNRRQTEDMAAVSSTAAYISSDSFERTHTERGKSQALGDEAHDNDSSGNGSFADGLAELVEEMKQMLYQAEGPEMQLVFEDETHDSFSTESAPSAENSALSLEGVNNSGTRGANESHGSATRGDVESRQNQDNEASDLATSRRLVVRNSGTPENYNLLASRYELRASFLYRLKAYEKSIIDVDMALKYGCPEENRHALLTIKNHCIDEISKNSRRKSKERGLIFSFGTSAPPVLQEQNPSIPAVSNAVKLAYSARAGRHLVAARDIKPGEVLGIEEPYCTALNLNAMSTYCCNCFRRCVTPLPCPNCSVVMFCSDECVMKDPSHPHWPVCRVMSSMVGLQLSTSGMLVIHLLMKLSFLQLQEMIESLLKEGVELPASNCGMNEQGIYDSTDFRTIFHSQSNIEKRSREELLDLCAEAFCITKVLQQSCRYFISEQNKHFEPEYEDAVMTGTMVFNLLMKLKSSSTSIGELKVAVDNYEKSWVENAGYGVYPAMNLINHSCHPTAALYNHGKTLVLHSVRSVSKGQSITISYGTKYRLVPKEFRMDVLKNNYFFDCDCDACTGDWYPEFDEVFELKCVKCERAIDMKKGVCSSCQIFYREGKEYKGDPPYNFFQVRDQLTQAAANCKKIKLKILKQKSTKKDRDTIVSAIELMEKYAKVPCTLLFDAQDALRISFEKEGSYVDIKDHTSSKQLTTSYLINSAWTGRRDISFQHIPKRSPLKRGRGRRHSFDRRDVATDVERTFDDQQDRGY